MADDRGSRIVAEIERLNSEEEHKRMLHDRSIGGPMALRPSKEFVHQHAGELKGEKQIADEAAHRVDVTREREAQELQNRGEVERSFRERASAPDKIPARDDNSEPKKPSLKQRIKEMSEGISNNASDQRNVGDNIGRGKGKDDPGIER